MVLVGKTGVSTTKEEPTEEKEKQQKNPKS